MQASSPTSSSKIKKGFSWVHLGIKWGTTTQVVCVVYIQGSCGEKAWCSIESTTEKESGLLVRCKQAVHKLLEDVSAGN
ncbi:hypothetical protein Pyn_13703 [Prunus yedoensis var. nudiflora]|uniref:Uncharacterized protein n=1 Tax=Prunus yedoensis var. nudiflora TaxID=2094558 RepID=A0A314UYU3_PRUYE|nr:hypothetical protein Pyn_13703 [Prunus yedoensis var. nudiflora]